MFIRAQREEGKEHAVHLDCKNKAVSKKSYIAHLNSESTDNQHRLQFHNC